MSPADLPAPTPGQTYESYVNSAVLAAAERWARWKAERGELPPLSVRAAAAAHRPTLLDALDGAAS